MFSVDIETIPNKNLIDCMPEPEYRYGNTKDESKREAIREEQRKKQIEDMALDPFFGRICSCAWYGGGYNQYHVIKEITDAEEIILINNILDSLRYVFSERQTHVVTWNGYEFDIPYIFNRAMILNTDIPVDCHSLKLFRIRHQTIPHLDLMQEFCGWKTGSHLKLDYVAGVLIGEKKLEHDFTKFIELIESGNGDQIGIYNLHDAEITFKLYEKAKKYLF